jgi:hypothetical protein
MMLDVKLTQLGLKIKNLVVLDLSFPQGKFPEFKKAYEQRYIHLPGRKEMALAFAGGLSAFGKVVLIYGVENDEVEVPDRTLNIKLVEEGPEGKWDIFEEELRAFGPAVLLIPEEV